MPMRTFPRDTKDSIEKLYGEYILRHFPRYGEFWSKFIGVKVRNGHLLPYGLRIPCQISNVDRARIRRAYDEICMAHYSMFCHLAGAHFQAQNLRDISSPNSSEANRFRHWEAFESVYLHLGICFNESSYLWKAFSSMQGLAVRKEDAFRAAGKLAALTNLGKVRIRITNRRNNITHYARGANRVFVGKFYVPEHARPNVTWYDELKTKHWWETRKKAALDLENTEDVIDACHEVLINSLATFLSNKRIRVGW